MRKKKNGFLQISILSFLNGRGQDSYRPKKLGEVEESDGMVTSIKGEDLLWDSEIGNKGGHGESAVLEYFWDWAEKEREELGSERAIRGWGWPSSSQKRLTECRESSIKVDWKYEKKMTGGIIF